jgi:3-deoxy-7-phosphoheptulonate synthase
MSHRTDDLRISWTKVVLAPMFLEEELPAGDSVRDFVSGARKQICDVLREEDSRIVVVVGPCSIHDVNAAREYAGLLKTAIAELSDDLCIVMRVYFEKPRTTIGWKGLINDPHLNETFKVNDGLRLARHLLLDLAEMGVPAGTEFLDLMTPQYFVDLVSWGAIGARTTESQAHRELASGLSCPAGFKNGTSGDVQVAIEAIQAARHPHCFLGHTKQGQSAIFGTSGNRDCHVILRGGRKTVNYTAENVEFVGKELEKAGLPARLMIDCSHANSGKDHLKQPATCRDVIRQIAGGDERIFGIMLESNLVPGAQKLGSGKSLVYGQSITDACMGWPETFTLLQEIAAARRERRKKLSESKWQAAESK